MFTQTDSLLAVANVGVITGKVVQRRRIFQGMFTSQPTTYLQGCRAHAHGIRIIATARVITCHVAEGQGILQTVLTIDFPATRHILGTHAKGIFQFSYIRVELSLTVQRLYEKRVASTIESATDIHGLGHQTQRLMVMTEFVLCQRHLVGTGGSHIVHITLNLLRYLALGLEQTVATEKYGHGLVILFLYHEHACLGLQTVLHTIIRLCKGHHGTGPKAE